VVRQGEKVSLFPSLIAFVVNNVLCIYCVLCVSCCFVCVLCMRFVYRRIILSTSSLFIVCRMEPVFGSARDTLKSLRSCRVS
jgi:hypothetical protein